jgi:hypothetical protein
MIVPPAVMALDLHGEPTAIKKKIVRHMVTAIVFCVSMLALGSQVSGREAMTVRVVPQSCIAPCDVVIQAFIEPNERNRSISFEVDSGMFFTRSVSGLEGDRAPRVKEVRFRDLPAGSYLVLVTLIGDDDRERAHLQRSVDLR